MWKKPKTKAYSNIWINKESHDAAENSSSKPLERSKKRWVAFQFDYCRKECETQQASLFSAITKKKKWLAVDRTWWQNSPTDNPSLPDPSDHVWSTSAPHRTDEMQWNVPLLEWLKDSLGCCRCFKLFTGLVQPGNLGLGLYPIIHHPVLPLRCPLSATPLGKPPPHAPASWFHHQ